MDKSSPFIPQLNSPTANRENQRCVELYCPLVELNAKHAHPTPLQKLSARRRSSRQSSSSSRCRWSEVGLCCCK